MRTGLSKKQKTTNVYFNEADSMVEVCTYNTALKKRLTEFAEKYPSECRLIDDDGNGCLTFEVSKGRFGFKLTAPYDENRRKAVYSQSQNERLLLNAIRTSEENKLLKQQIRRLKEKLKALDQEGSGEND